MAKKIIDDINEKWVDVEDVAEHLGIKEETVRTWARQGKLPRYKVGKRYKFKLSEIDAIVRDGKLG